MQLKIKESTIKQANPRVAWVVLTWDPQEGGLGYETLQAHIKIKS